ncbi:hypothetical protein GGH12_000675 [Coemansia sp. RSA 1822]|nr:hypothetical protein LPJ76_002810 [Coemansia sp. RSA 638]KAJ2126152.1 hypothetical protein IW147_000303 [Coemansia sp. RSA 720]KAJ2566717.1 hypothetical protein GGH12_000675 [Coemansia sp. RSA 1822]
MEVEVPSSSLKTFYKALQCLSRISNDISIEAREDQLELSSVNSARSAFASFTFRRGFFDAYKIGQLNYASQNGPVLRCKVLAKPLVGVFKMRGAGKGREVEKCMLRIEQGTELGHAGPNEDNFAGECRLVVRVTYKEGICRTHRMFYEVSELLHPVFNVSDFKSMWRVSAKVAGDWISHFSRGLEEVSFCMSASDVVLRSWSEGQYATGRNIDAATNRLLETEISLVPAEFDTYDIAGTRTVELTFSLRELKAALQYADATEQPLTARFNRGGDPLVLTVSPVHVERNTLGQSASDMTAEFIIATRTEYDSQDVRSATPHRARAVQTVESADATPLVCERVDEISMHLERSGRSAVYEIDPKVVASPSPFQSSRGSNAHDVLGLNMDIDRSDSLLHVPASANSRRANSAHARAGQTPVRHIGAQTPVRHNDGTASQPDHQTPDHQTPNHQTPVCGSFVNHMGTTVKSYRLLDMPRPHAPPGVTEALFEQSGPEDSEDVAPNGRIQTRLPYQANHTQRGDNASDASSDEELDATPPPPSKRMRSLF